MIPILRFTFGGGGGAVPSGGVGLFGGTQKSFLLRWLAKSLWVRKDLRQIWQCSEYSFTREEEPELVTEVV